MKDEERTVKMARQQTWNTFEVGSALKEAEQHGRHKDARGETRVLSEIGK